MDISQQLAGVLDALAERFGLAIDWSSTNVVPYIKDLMARFARYEIAESIIWIVSIGVISGIIVGAWRYVAKKHKKESSDGTWKCDYRWELPPQILFAWSAIMALVFVGVLCYQIAHIIRASTLPESVILQYAYRFATAGNG